ncbi:MAG: HEAT repeat domain-containing protein [Candidatus Aminicenantes bacterium]|jgi:HEAT repeat protein
MGPERPKQIEPYKGLRPYEEENRDIFFGRDQEREILIDKLFSNKLTLLFAATGVGKSSLLQAAVMPELQRPERLNLDVVYYTDWVSNPLERLKQKTIQVLKERGKVGFDYQINEGASLKELFQLCSTFASEPLVVILDQFEEFFQYRRYQEDFIPFVKEFSQCVMDRVTPTAFIISMREDFALELNVFKDYLPTTLFENYFRLEKLKGEKARDAICKPVEPFGFHYEEKLLDTLLKDLADREKEAHLGTSPSRLMKDIPAYVEPPYLQIVCTRLWEADKHNSKQKIRMESYEKMGRAKGFVDSYFNEVMNQFSHPDKKIASLAFNHLVTPRGTKMAYTVKDLRDRIRIDKKDLEYTLEKLRKSRILRSQKREGVIWYELYHDIFSNIINQWNEKFKTKQRIKRVSFLSAMAILAFIVLFFIYDIITNSTNYYISLSPKTSISDTIEVCRGKLNTPDILNLNKYKAETVYQRSQVEPDKLFNRRPIYEYYNLNVEIIGNLPIIERISSYWDAGEIKKALDLADKSIYRIDATRREYIIQALVSFRSKESYKILKKHMISSKDRKTRLNIITNIRMIDIPEVVEDLIVLLNDETSQVAGRAASTLGWIDKEEATVHLLHMLKKGASYKRIAPAFALGRIGSLKAVTPLINNIMDNDRLGRLIAVGALGMIGSVKSFGPLKNLIKDNDPYIRRNAARSLGRIDYKKSLEFLIPLLKDPNSMVREEMASFLGQVGNAKIVEPLLELIADNEPKVRCSAAEALSRTDHINITKALINLLKDQNPDVRLAAVNSLEKVANEEDVELLIPLLKDYREYVRRSVIEALGRIGSVKSLYPLIILLKDQSEDVRDYACEALGQIGSEKAAIQLLGLLKNHDYINKVYAVDALGNIGDERALPSLISLLKDHDASLRSSVAEALGKIGSPEVDDDLKNLLMDSDSEVRLRAAEALGKIGSPKAIKPLIVALKYDDSDVRRQAAETLGNIGSAIAIKPLIATLNDEDEELRSCAIEALEKLRSGEAVLALVPKLKDFDPMVRSKAVYSLGKIGSTKVLNLLIPCMLNDYNEIVRANVAEALSRINNKDTLSHLADLLNDHSYYVRRNSVLSIGKLFGKEKARLIKNIFRDKQETFLVRLAASATLLTIGDEEGLTYLKEKFRSNKTKERIEVIKVLGEAPSNQGISILIKMLNDENIHVKENVILSLGKAKAVSSLPYLYKLIQEPNTRIRAAVVNALSEIASPDSIELLKNVAVSTGERIPTRAKAIDALAKIPHKDSLQALIELLNNQDDIIQFKTIIAIGTNPPSKAIPGDLINQLKFRLNDKLKGLEKRKARWRQIRDESTEDYNQEQMDEWRSRLKEVEPREPLEFELAFALSRIDPVNEGIKLLGHHLANVREGAWMGLGKSRSTSLIEKLYWKRKESKIPWFRHAAYRAIDHILINIEAFGGKEELNRLETLYKNLSEKEGKDFHEGVQTRMEWTIERLKERVVGH